MSCVKVFIALVILINCGTSEAQTRSSFHQTCNETVACDSWSLLRCENGICECHVGMEFDINREKCVVLAGYKCKSTSTASAATPSWNIDNEVWTLDCLDNATCNINRICECHMGFDVDSQGHCIQKKIYNESCERHEECSTSANLICDGGKCLCNQREAVYYEDGDEGICVGKVGASCEKYSRCIQNAREIKSKCQCDKNFKETEDGLCLGGHGAECDPGRFPCNDELSCINGKCECHFPDFQWYDYESGKCMSQINGPCQETIKGKLLKYECPEEAECRNDNGLPECLCKKGYSRWDEGICRKTFGTPCRSTRECNQRSRFTSTALICREGICSCRDFQIYDGHTSQCVKGWGAKCMDNQECIENAYCKRYPNDSNSYGACQCISGAKVDSDRKCVRMYLHNKNHDKLN